MLSKDSLLQWLEPQLPAALAMLQKMVAINSFTGNRDGVNRVGQLTEECFAPLGFAAERVPSANPAWGDHLVLTHRGKGPRSVAMISHLDTVFPPEEEVRNNFHWQREGDRIFGPGTHDIKGGTVMMWLTLSALRHFAPVLFEGTIWRLFFNSSEESLSPDFGEVCRRRLDRNTVAALVFEAEGRLDKQPLLVAARKGRATWRITVTGRGAHAGGKHPYGANAIVQLARTVEKIQGLTDYQRDLTFNVAMISGGTVTNRVPHEAVADGEFRTFKPEVFAQAKSALLALAGPGSVSSPVDKYACEIQVEIRSESRPWPRNPGTDRLLEIWKKAGAQLGIAVGEELRGGLSDGNYLWDVLPTIDGLGPWGDNDHCSERNPDGSKLPEYVEASSFVPKAALNTLAIVQMMESIAASS
jgi:glutamate carboxypeptidase